MSREIKFRALVPVNSDEPKTMQYFDLSEIDDLNQLAAADWDINQLMQFTGLIDKNGKEVYEGDVIKSEKNTWVIENKFGCFLMRFISGEFHPSNGFILSYDFNIDHYEVIGNIYQNPDLLK